MTSIRQIARQIGVHPSTVKRRLDRGADPAVAISPQAGVPCPSRGRLVPVDATEAEIIRNGVQFGMKSIEIAQELGVSRMTVCRRGAKIGLDMRRGSINHPDTLRRVVQDMTRDEAIEYLLEVVEQIVGQDKPLQRDVGGATLEPQQAIIFAMLNRYIGQNVSKERIWLAIAAGRPNEGPDIRAVSVQVSRMRRLLRSQYRIETVWGFGYRMVKA